MRLVLDTAVMVAALRSGQGSSRRLLVAGLRRQVLLLVSVPLLLEYESVMLRLEHLEASGASAADVSALLDAVAAMAEVVLLDFLWRPALRDPDDDMVLETAVNGRADALVTFNRKDFMQPAARLGVPILLPGEVARSLERNR
jgi:putative PIN family toxin of toxin-antitoxin system